MNARQFYEEVKKMRELQKKYFATHSHRVMEASIQVEQRIDAEIERVEKLLKERTESQQLTINFDNYEAQDIPEQRS